MALRPWDHLDEETLAQFKVFDVVRAQRRSPRTGAELGMFLVRTWDWVQIVALTTEDEFLAVRQYRQGSAALSLEIPGGVIPPGEDPAAAASRELREETGYEASALHRLGSVSPNPAIFCNTLHTFLATGCRRVGEPTMDPGEDLEVERIGRPELEDLARHGGIDNALVLSALYVHALHSGEQGA